MDIGSISSDGIHFITATSEDEKLALDSNSAKVAESRNKRWERWNGAPLVIHGVISLPSFISFICRDVKPFFCSAYSFANSVKLRVSDKCVPSFANRLKHPVLRKWYSSQALDSYGVRQSLDQCSHPFLETG
jgi:hypothetical protein